MQALHDGNKVSDNVKAMWWKYSHAGEYVGDVGAKECEWLALCTNVSDLQYLGDEGDMGEVGEYLGDEGDI